ncbi:ZZ-type zinc finger-containing protein 3-like isoform X2 [Mytilus galloprovincialis]|uniref:ZZ-type zinc finger-containing protein 3-like isoform X2 n=1 Tax=Mytilus galloprovincialis TaxID=29158 RepID=UPI003F7B56A3
MDASSETRLMESTDGENQPMEMDISKVKAEIDEEIDTYYFESDHVALKGNADYHAMLRTIALLEAQRIQAISDLDRLYKCRDDALEDPIGFVDKLQRGEDLNLPKQQRIAELPMINWEKYTSTVDFTSLGIPKHLTRLKKQLVNGAENEQKPINANFQSFDGQSSLVRGRIKEEGKSATFNQLWSIEEQKRLEDLLITYPPEDVEAKRWQKIATAIGNRTPQQVASRVQKYFIKLAKAGLPIPGRMPNVGNFGIKKQGHRHHKYHKFYYQPSTFLQSHQPPVYMSDDDESQSFHSFGRDNDDSQGSMPEEYEYISDDESIPVELRDSEDYEELMKLKRLRKQKLQSLQCFHEGFKCDKCEVEPIPDTRWHCLDCPIGEEVDFCEDCVDSNFETGKHNSSHRLKPIRLPSKDTCVKDRDYMTFMPGDYNYLDPNYMPAT